MRAAERWYENEMTASVQHNRTLVIGLGKTGLSAARFLAARGNDVLVIDSRSNPPGVGELRHTHPEVSVVLESLDPQWLEGVTEVVLSPGLGLDTPIAAEAVRRGIPVVSDIELFARLATAPVLAVTGSNGKSTVVTLVEQMLSASGLSVAAGGNLGPPALELLGEDPEAYVLEVSSFQLETTQSLKPLAAAVLNVSPDHLDRHGSLQHYAALKARLLKPAATAVFNWDDPRVRAMGSDHAHGIPFSVREPLERGYCILNHEGERWLSRDGEPLLPVSAMRIQGLHNEANALAALALGEATLAAPGPAEASSRGRETAPLLETIEHYAGLPHRCQWVGEEPGIQFINDSKGTNVGATVAALQGLRGPFVLIAGGQSKGADFRPLVAAARDKLVGAVVIGEAAAELEAGLSSVVPVRGAEKMTEALTRACELANESDASRVTVLLSPACASLDMFGDYAARGEAFVAAVGERQR